ncbi:lipase family protein [Actinomyces weissii]|uniref:Uncharacterized protein n=1 Tax=Actinomyces weissii TaxID=675090 RepID=A0A7T7M9A4_9ACTO|nr:hypothetical protein [Actinomyces weissii]QQM67278.1 hypothetical protein JG540_09835 [Actinomyces weissii]
MIHGIGNQKTGSLLKGWGPPIADEITRQALTEGWGVEQESLPDQIRLRVTHGNKSQTIALHEIIWSQSFERPGLREMMAWSISRLPLALLLLTPNGNDLKALLRMQDSNFKPSWREMLKIAVPLFTRLMLVIGIPCVTLLLTNAALTDIPLASRVAPTVTLLAVFLAILTHSRWNLAGHIKIASQISSARRKAMDQKLETELQRILSTAKTTTIIAHSQGGFLAHQAVNNNRRLKVARFIGVGSGLRPISIISALDDRRHLIAAWLYLIFPFLLMSTFIFANHSPAWLQMLTFMIRVIRHTLQASLWPPSTPELLLGPLQPTASEIPDLSITSYLPPPITWVLLALSIATALGFALILKRNRLPNIMPLNQVQEWLEITSPNDLVGRIPLPKLPSTCQQIEVAAQGNPLLDHITYFKPTSMTPRIIASKLLSDVSTKPFKDRAADSLSIATYLQQRTRRRWRLATLLIWSPLAPLVLLFTLTPSLSLLFFIASAFTLTSIPVRVLQYACNSFLVRHDANRILNGFTELTSPPHQVDKVSGGGNRTVGALLFIGYLLLSESGLWAFAYVRELTPFSAPTPTLMLLLTTGLVEIVCAAAIISGYAVKLTLVNTIMACTLALGAFLPTSWHPLSEPPGARTLASSSSLIILAVGIVDAVVRRRRIARPETTASN